jgi:hypothetical protein
MAAFITLFDPPYLIPENLTPLYYKQENGLISSSPHPCHFLHISFYTAGFSNSVCSFI